MQPSKSYHIYTHANGSENLFQTDENFRYFLSRYEEFIPGVADTLAWCLMPNHLHLLVRIKSEAELKAFFKNKLQDLTGLASEDKQDLSGLERLTILQFSHLFNAYTKAYNKFNKKRRGSLFTRSFKRKEITSDSYFTSIIHYIHHNPVHHGFVKQITDWPWSSYHNFMLPNLRPIQQEIINWFGNREQFMLFHQQALGHTENLDHD
jgi:REP element-mobilizing transposase RayT